ncbi:MAG TPA: NAD-dependent epimerase/dehydratase family protein [Allosphingosinicella sp.]|nr:NAD-dependent epimerase/dehydratase family protein [Allosphingosinicella sp.]
MKVLITGGAGFVGSQLGKHLHRRGDEVVLLDNMRFGHLDNLLLEGSPFGRFVCKDVRDGDLVALFEGVDTLFHLAGIAALPVCQEAPAEAYDVNTAAVANVLEAARRADVRRIVFSSTSAVYEKTKSERFAESDPIAPDLVYASSKAAAESVCDAFARNYGLDIVICRFFNVYGPHQDVTRTSPPFTSYVARELVMDRAPTLFNDSSARRDYVHSDDVVDLLTRMIEAEGEFRAERYNVCSGQGHSVPELYGHFLAASGKSIEPVFRDPSLYWEAYPALFGSAHPLSRERIVEEVYKNAIGDPAKTRARFGWNPATEIGAGIASVYADARRRLCGAGPA